MESHLFVLMMHMAAGPGSPVDMPVSAYETNARCLAMAGSFAEDDKRNKVLGVTYSCKQVPFAGESPKQ